MKGNSKAKAALPKAQLVSTARPQKGGLPNKEPLRITPPDGLGLLPIFPYLSSVYRDFVGCYLKCYQQHSNIHKPYVRTIEASATRTMYIGRDSQTG
jgi:hypothetical protein